MRCGCGAASEVVVNLLDKQLALCLHHKSYAAKYLERVSATYVDTKKKKHVSETCT